MYPRLVSLSGRAPLALGAVAVALTAATLAWDVRAKPDAVKTAPTSVFGKPEPARNPVTLQLLADDRQVAAFVENARQLAGGLPAGRRLGRCGAHFDFRAFGVKALGKKTANLL